jgi:hypothetical protein
MAKVANKSNSKEMATKDWNKELRSQYDEEVENAPALGDAWVKTKKGTFEFQGFVGAEMRVVVLGWVFEHAFYEAEFQAGVSASPVCWALGRREVDLFPDPDSSKAQYGECPGCPHNQFGSGRNGQGKRCRDGFRLAVLVLHPDGSDGSLGFMRLGPHLRQSLSHIRQHGSQDGQAGAAILLVSLGFRHHRDVSENHL